MPPRGQRNVNAASATTLTAEQRFQRFYYELPTRQVQAFSMSHRKCRRSPVFFTPSNQPRPVEEVARELVGHFLICKESDVVMRIVETEAYQEREAIYRPRFDRAPPAFRSPAGFLVPYTIAFGRQFMLITAGADDSRDLVLLRTCDAVHGHLELASRVNLTAPVTPHKQINMMNGPTKVAMALAPDLGGNCNLLDPSRGLYLLRPDTNIPLIRLHGHRILPKDSTHTTYSSLNGANSLFRFAFHGCPQRLKLRSHMRRIENQP